MESCFTAISMLIPGNLMRSSTAVRTVVIVEKFLKEQVFPLMLHKNTAEKFSFEDCKYPHLVTKLDTGIIFLQVGFTFKGKRRRQVVLYSGIWVLLVATPLKHLTEGQTWVQEHSLISIRMTMKAWAGMVVNILAKCLFKISTLQIFL